MANDERKKHQFITALGKGHVFHVDVFINGQPIRALLDSGACSENTLHYLNLTKEKLKPCSLTAFGVNGGAVKFTGTITLPYKIAGAQLRDEFYVFQSDDHAMILGQDILSQLYPVTFTKTWMTC